MFNSSVAHANLERQLVAAQTTRMELETKLREKEALIERLESDRRWFVDRVDVEREEKEREDVQRETDKVHQHPSQNAKGRGADSFTEKE